MMDRSGRVLYFAPEEPILDYLRSNPEFEVKTSNYMVPTADYDIDIMNIPFEDATWDYVICHRVIEHIPDDRKGMQELYRILRPGGTLLLSVPIYRENTVDYGEANLYENGHFYAYGHDFIERIPKEFEITRHTFSKLFSPEEFSELELFEDYIFICKKPA